MGGGWAEAETHWQRHGPVRNIISHIPHSHRQQRPQNKLFTSPCTPQAKKTFQHLIIKFRLIVKKILKLDCAEAHCCIKTSCNSREYVE